MSDAEQEPGEGAKQQEARLGLVLLTRRFWPLADGPARNMANLGAALADHGHHVTVLSARWARSGRQKRCLATCDWCDWSPPPRSGWNMVRWIKATARFVAARRDQIDLIYVSASSTRLKPPSAQSAVACVVLRAESAGPRGDCQWQRNALCGRHIESRCHQSDAVVAPTPTIEEELIAAGYRRSRIHALATGVPIPPVRDLQGKIAGSTLWVQLTLR